jgi:hypothetical protein
MKKIVFNLMLAIVISLVFAAPAFAQSAGDGQSIENPQDYFCFAGGGHTFHADMSFNGGTYDICQADDGTTCTALGYYCKFAYHRENCKEIYENDGHPGWQVADCDLDTTVEQFDSIENCILGSGYWIGDQCVVTTCPQNADLNSDGKVNILDYTILITNFMSVGRQNSDINCDSKVNILDYSTLVINFFS